MFGSTDRKRLVEVNLGEASADLAVRNGTLVNVHTGELLDDDVAIAGDRIAAVGDIEHAIGDETTVVDAAGRFVTPGLIEGHLHSYHSYVNGTGFARLLLQHGTTACADGFYGQAIVGGERGATFAKEEVQATPVKSIFLVPVLAYQQMTTVGIPRGETGLSLDEMLAMIQRDDCYGLEEPTYEPVVDLEDEYFELFERTLSERKVITGHAALPSDRELSAFIAAGTSTDHEMTDSEGTLDRTRRGMSALSRHGTGLPNLLETVKPVVDGDIDARRFGMSGDVRLPGDLKERGCIDQNVRDAIGVGVEPVTAVQMATINTAEALRVDQELGSIAPGKVADLVLVDDLETFEIEAVVADGEVVVEDGQLAAEIDQPEYPEWALETIDLGREVTPETFVVEAEGDSVRVRTIDIPEGAALLTDPGEAELPVEDGAVQPVVEDDILKVAMLDRLEASGRTGVGFVEGFDLGKGALGISYNAVRENVVVIGTNDSDMAHVVNRIEALNGGVVAVSEGDTRAEVPLPLFGLQSIEPVDTAIEQFEAMDEAIRNDLECDRENPLFGLEFLLCPYPETPGVRISDYGLYDVGERERLELFL